MTWIIQVNKSEADKVFPKRNLRSESSQNIQPAYNKGFKKLVKKLESKVTHLYSITLKTNTCTYEIALE